MTRTRPQSELLRNALLALLGGAVVYLLTRDPQTVSALRFSPLPLWSGALVHCWLCLALPSLLHVYAFTLLSASVARPRTRRQALSLCLFWVGIEVFFELGQTAQLAAWIHDLLPAQFGNYPMLSLTHDYFIYGTFDPLDLLFIGLGALAAYRSLLGIVVVPEVEHDRTKAHNPMAV